MVRTKLLGAGLCLIPLITLVGCGSGGGAAAPPDASRPAIIQVKAVHHSPLGSGLTTWTYDCPTGYTKLGLVSLSDVDHMAGLCQAG